jgi:hypothetical protein
MGNFEYSSEEQRTDNDTQPERQAPWRTAADDWSGAETWNRCMSHMGIVAPFGHIVHTAQAEQHPDDTLKCVKRKWSARWSGLSSQAFSAEILSFS